jgi:transposase
MPDKNAHIKELEDYIQHLEKENGDLKDKLEDTTKKLDETTKELNMTLRKLKVYENPHTPSSQQMTKKKMKSTSPAGKRGAPKGHKGVSRKRRDTDNIIIVQAEKCEKCSSTNLKPIKKKEKTIEEIAEVPEPEAVKFVRDKVKCRECGHVFTAKHKECPINGRFGVNLMVLIIMFKFLPRAVLRRIVELLEHTYHLRITASSTNSVISRVAEGASKEYGVILERIRRAGVVYADETGMSVLGKKWWLWIFRTDTDIAVVIRNSRGGKVPREILGEDFYNVLVRDGWKAYNSLKHALVQRCWAHLLREAKDHIDSTPGNHMYEKLCIMFKDIKVFIKDEHEEDIRKEKFMEFNKRMKSLLGYYSRYPELGELITYAKNGGSHWFTCILVEGVEPTNNLAEQPIREHVVMRKIIGAIRSTDGVRVYETLASLIATWRLNDVNISVALKKMITQNLCLAKS